MPRKLTAKQAEALAKDGKATYKPGQEPVKEFSVENAFFGLHESIKELRESVDITVNLSSETKDSIGSQPDYRDVLTNILELVDDITVTLAEVSESNAREMRIIKNLFSSQNPEEWHFDINKDVTGAIKTVTAKQVNTTH